MLMRHILLFTFETEDIWCVSNSIICMHGLMGKKMEKLMPGKKVKPSEYFINQLVKVFSEYYDGSFHKYWPWNIDLKDFFVKFLC